MQTTAARFGGVLRASAIMTTGGCSPPPAQALVSTITWARTSAHQRRQLIASADSFAERPCACANNGRNIARPNRRNSCDAPQERAPANFDAAPAVSCSAAKAARARASHFARLSADGRARKPQRSTWQRGSGRAPPTRARTLGERLDLQAQDHKWAPARCLTVRNRPVAEQGADHADHAFQRVPCLCADTPTQHGRCRVRGRGRRQRRRFDAEQVVHVSQ